VDEEGRLVARTPLRDLVDGAPLAYQVIEGKKVPVEARYRLQADLSYGFALGAYDVAQALVIDPAHLVYCGYIGGLYSDEGHGIAVDGTGNAYIMGYTKSPQTSFPDVVGPDGSYNGGDEDAFVAKVNAAGTARLYCGFIGGGFFDHGNGIAVDAAGNAYVTGFAESTQSSFPIVVGPDLTHNGSRDAFVAKVSTNPSYTPASLWRSAFGVAQGWTSQDRYPRMVGDVNGDWHADVVGFGRYGTMVSLSNGSTFAALTSWIANFGTDVGAWTSQDFYPRALGDVNHDQKVDIVGFGSAGTFVSLSQ
jgi:hypothetical protein